MSQRLPVLTVQDITFCCCNHYPSWCAFTCKIFSELRYYYVDIQMRLAAPVSFNVLFFGFKKGKVYTTTCYWTPTVNNQRNMMCCLQRWLWLFWVERFFLKNYIIVLWLCLCPSFACGKKDTLDMSMLQRICIYILSRVLLGYPWASLTFPKRKERLAGHLSNWIPGDAESQETWWRNKPGISCEPAFERVFSRWSLPDLTYYWTVQWSGAQGIYPQLLGCCMI